ncbi:MAG: hypothetical protein ACK4PK_11065 [Alphaproteobacteria bacterium]
MSSPKRHFYRLAGESLHALDRLIEYDRIKTDWKIESLMEQVRTARGEETPQQPKNTDTATPARGLMQDFNAAQIKAYQKALGFHDLPVQVRDYADGTIYRAYKVLPKFLMNPGTSKMFFGLADLFNKPDTQPKERTAFCISYEDYKGNHFAPPGAQKLTDDEFYAHEGVEDDFEHYREYDQGTDMPADFDPEKHLTVKHLPKKGFAISSATHNFILQDDVQKEIAAYDSAYQDWQMAFQDFRHRFEDFLRPLLFGKDTAPVNVWIEDTAAPKEELFFSLRMPRPFFEKHRTRIEYFCDILAVREQENGILYADMRPSNHSIARQIMSDFLMTVPAEPRKPALHSTLPGSVIDRKQAFNAEKLGFPYMHIERPQDPDTRIFAFRLPSNIGTVEPPNADCTPLSADEYAALSSAEDYFDKNNPPSHAFRIGGDTLKALQAFEKADSDCRTKNDGFRRRIEDILRKDAPDCKIDRYELAGYKLPDRARELTLVLSEKDYQRAKESLLQEGLEESYPSREMNGMRHLQLKTREGSALRAMLDEVPYDVYFPMALGKALGFYANDGYSLMCTENLSGTKQKAVLYIFPPYIKDVTPPEGTYALDKESFMHFIADSFDIQGGTVPPPRPPHIKGLPSAEGKSLDHARSIRDGLKQDGFPLGPRSDSGWFRRPPQR